MKAQLQTESFNKIIDATKDFVLKNNSRPQHTYVRLEFCKEDMKVTAIAVNGFIMAVHKCDLLFLDCDFVAYIKPNMKLPRYESAVLELEGEYLTVFCGDNSFGFRQPTAEFLDWQKVLPAKEPSFEIYANIDYMISALKSIKNGRSTTSGTPICKMIFRSALDPIIVQENKDMNNIGMVLPVRGGRED